MDDKMICLWREAFKISHFLSSINISHRRHQNIFPFNMRNAHFDKKNRSQFPKMFKLNWIFNLQLFTAGVFANLSTDKLCFAEAQNVDPKLALMG